MGRKSTFRFIPKEIVSEIDRLLSEDRATLDEIVEHLRQLGVDEVSRSALGRRKQKIDKAAKLLRESREMVDALVGDVGPSVAEGKQGRLLVETLRKLAYDHLLSKDDGSEVTSQDFFFLSKSLKELSHASRLDQDFESKVRERVEKEVVAKMEAAAKKAGAEAGEELSAEVAFARIKAIYHGEA